MTGIHGNESHLMYYYDSMNLWLKPFNYNLINDNRIVIRLNALIMLLSGKNIYLNMIVLNFIFVFGLMGIYKFAITILKTPTIATYIAILLPPSLLFWGSGMLKEGIVTTILGLLLWSYSKIIRNPRNLLGYIWLLISILLFTQSKFYVLFAIIPALISYLLCTKYKKSVIIFSSIHILLFTLIFTLPKIGFPLNIPEVLTAKQHDFINFTNSIKDIGSSIYLPSLQPSWSNFSLNGIRGFFTTLLRPTILDYSSIASIPAIIENIIIILGITLMVYFFKAKKITKEILFLFSFVFILFAVAGMTTPILGALVRYKTPGLPFLWILIFSFYNREKVNNYIKNNKTTHRILNKLIGKQYE